MSHKDRSNIDLDKILDRVVDEIRDDVMAADTEKAAMDRVWQRVRNEAESIASQAPENQRIRDCGDFQALIPAYAQGALNDAKRLLFEDHISECLPCRKALKRARAAGRPAPAVVPASGPGWVSRIGWQAAAAAVIFLAVVGLSFNSEVLKIRAGGLVQIESIDGELLRVSDEGSVPVAAGDQFMLTRGESLRTTKGSRAMIRLADESAMEMKERSEIGVLDESYFWNRADKDAVLELERGAVIVEASEQGSGHLFVETDDSKIAVTGTVFSVNSGIKGTRVSVIEGQVRVDNRQNKDDILLAGQQTTSQPGLEKIDVATEIAWSQNLEKHIRLMREMIALGRDIDEVFYSDRRHSTRLLDLTPDNTVVYIGIPNVSAAVAEAHTILLEKVHSSEALQAWWNENVVPNNGDAELAEMIETITGYGEHLGQEIVVTLQLEDAGVESPLVLAELSQSAAAFKGFLEKEQARLRQSGRLRDHFAIVEGPRPDLSGMDAEVFFWLQDDLLAVGGRDAVLRLAAARLTIPQSVTGKTTSGLRQQLEDRYRDGVEWIVGVDMRTILNQDDTAENREMEALGLLDITQLIAERKTHGNHTDNRAVLSFSQARRGIAAWLDEPAPMGSLEFISPDASAAAAFVMQEPAAMVDDLFDTLTSINDDFRDQLEAFEQENSISIRDDIAATLGGEFALALDGPILPTPSWKVIIEVYNAEQLQQTLLWAVDQVNEVATEAGKRGLAIHLLDIGGRTVYQLESLDVGISAYYTFVDGYFLAGPSTAVLQRALQIRQSGATLPASTRFRSMLSRDNQVHFSGVVYQNLGTILGPLAHLSGAARSLSPEAARMADEIAQNSLPSVTTVYGEPERITFINSHEGGFFGSSLSSFFSFKSLMDVGELLEHSNDG